MLATGSRRQIRVYDVASGRVVTSIEPPEPDDHDPENSGNWFIRSVVFSPNSRLLASGGEDRVVRIWDVPSGAMVQCLVGHTDEIYSLDWAQDGRTLISGSGDQSCRVWDVESGQCLMVLVNDKVVFDGAAGSPQETGVTSVALSPRDGKCLATLADRDAAEPTVAAGHHKHLAVEVRDVTEGPHCSHG
ncbi:general transcription repressor [Cladochytrium tenue]|nr:general transcription repressor [Cladochytrium tenue]